MFKVAITGGIGSGKSTLCNKFRELGVPIYNSDAKAKELMSMDIELRTAIVKEFGEKSFQDGELNRRYLAELVFNNSDNLSKLNSLVHPRVKADFSAWSEKQNAQYVILESAILFEAKFEECVDKVLCVLSPSPLRIERVVTRDGITKEEVEQRIKNQLSDEEIHAQSDFCVVNIDLDDLDDAANIFDKKFRYAASQC